MIIDVAPDQPGTFSLRVERDRTTCKVTVDGHAPKRTSINADIVLARGGQLKGKVTKVDATRRMRPAAIEEK